MSSRLEENTLGVAFGRRYRGGEASTAARAVALANARWASLGSNHLGSGAAVIAAIVTLANLAHFASHAKDNPAVLPASLAWLLLIVAFCSVRITSGSYQERLPNWAFAAYIAALAGVIALDFVAIWPLENVGNYATASVSAGWGLLAVLTIRPARDLFLAAAVILLAFVAATVLSSELTAETLPTQITTAALAVLPAVFGIITVRRFQRMVQLQLDRVLVQSTVSAPRFAVGMLASEELARLDLAAEELLDSVASGRTALPLRPKTASTAAALATELRLHLIEGRRETWLYHAITESEQLGKSATLKDPGSLAGLLDPKQRDGLLSAVWMLVSERKKVRTTAEVVLGPVVPTQGTPTKRTIIVPVVITTTGVSRTRLDPSIWAAVDKMGRFTAVTENLSLRVDIQCVVANPADR